MSNPYIDAARARFASGSRRTQTQSRSRNGRPARPSDVKPVKSTSSRAARGQRPKTKVRRLETMSSLVPKTKEELSALSINPNNTLYKNANVHPSRTIEGKLKPRPLVSAQQLARARAAFLHQERKYVFDYLVGLGLRLFRHHREQQDKKKKEEEEQAAAAVNADASSAVEAKVEVELEKEKEEEERPSTPAPVLVERDLDQLLFNSSAFCAVVHLQDLVREDVVVDSVAELVAIIRKRSALWLKEKDRVVSLLRAPSSMLLPPTLQSQIYSGNRDVDQLLADAPNHQVYSVLLRFMQHRRTFQTVWDLRRAVRGIESTQDVGRPTSTAETIVADKRIRNRNKSKHVSPAERRAHEILIYLSDPLVCSLFSEVSAVQASEAELDQLLAECDNSAELVIHIFRQLDMEGVKFKGMAGLVQAVIAFRAYGRNKDAVMAKTRALVIEYLVSEACELFSEAIEPVVASDQELDKIIYVCGTVESVVAGLERIDSRGEKFDSVQEMIGSLVHEVEQDWDTKLALVTDRVKRMIPTICTNMLHNESRMVIEDYDVKKLVRAGQQSTLFFINFLLDQSRVFDNIAQLIHTVGELYKAAQAFKRDIAGFLRDPQHMHLLANNTAITEEDVDNLFFKSGAGHDTPEYLQQLINEGQYFESIEDMVHEIHTRYALKVRQNKQLMRQTTNASDRARVKEVLTSVDKCALLAGCSEPLDDALLTSLLDTAHNNADMLLFYLAELNLRAEIFPNVPKLITAVEQMHMAATEEKQDVLDRLNHPECKLFHRSARINLVDQDVEDLFVTTQAGFYLSYHLDNMQRAGEQYTFFNDLLAAVRNAVIHLDEDAARIGIDDQHRERTQQNSGRESGRHTPTFEERFDRQCTTLLHVLTSDECMLFVDAKNPRIAKESLGNVIARAGSLSLAILYITYFNNSCYRIDSAPMLKDMVTKAAAAREGVVRGIHMFLTQPSCELLEAKVKATLTTEEAEMLYSAAGPLTLKIMAHLAEFNFGLNMRGLIVAIKNAERVKWETHRSMRDMLSALLLHPLCTLFSDTHRHHVATDRELQELIDAAGSGAGAFYHVYQFMLSGQRFSNVGGLVFAVKQAAKATHYIEGLCFQYLNSKSFTMLQAVTSVNAIADDTKTEKQEAKDEKTGDATAVSGSVSKQAPPLRVTREQVAKLFALGEVAGPRSDIIPILWALQASGKSFSSFNGLIAAVRTTHILAWHPEASEVLVLATLLADPSCKLFYKSATVVVMQKALQDLVEVADGGSSALSYVLDLRCILNRFSTLEEIIEAVSEKHAEHVERRTEVLRLLKESGAQLFAHASATLVADLSEREMDDLFRIGSSGQVLFFVEQMLSAGTEFASFEELLDRVRELSHESEAGNRHVLEVLLMYLRSPGTGLLADPFAISEGDLWQLFRIAGSGPVALYLLFTLNAQMQTPFATLRDLERKVKEHLLDVDFAKEELTAWFHCKDCALLNRAEKPTPAEIEDLMSSGGAGPVTIMYCRILSALGTKHDSWGRVIRSVADAAKQATDFMHINKYMTLVYIVNPTSKLFVNKRKISELSMVRVDRLIQDARSVRTCLYYMNSLEDGGASYQSVSALSAALSRTVRSADRHIYEIFCFLTRPECMLLASNVSVSKETVGLMYEVGLSRAKTIQRLKYLEASKIKSGDKSNFNSLDELGLAIRRMRRVEIDNENKRVANGKHSTRAVMAQDAKNTIISSKEQVAKMVLLDFLISPICQLLLSKPDADPVSVRARELYAMGVESGMSATTLRMHCMYLNRLDRHYDDHHDLLDMVVVLEARHQRARQDILDFVQNVECLLMSASTKSKLTLDDMRVVMEVSEAYYYTLPILQELNLAVVTGKTIMIFSNVQDLGAAVKKKLVHESTLEFIPFVRHVFAVFTTHATSPVPYFTQSQLDGVDVDELMSIAGSTAALMQLLNDLTYEEPPTTEELIARVREQKKNVKDYQKKAYAYLMSENVKIMSDAPEYERESGMGFDQFLRVWAECLLDSTAQSHLWALEQNQIRCANFEELITALRLRRFYALVKDRSSRQWLVTYLSNQSRRLLAADVRFNDECLSHLKELGPQPSTLLYHLQNVEMQRGGKPLEAFADLIEDVRVYEREMNGRKREIMRFLHGPLCHLFATNAQDRPMVKYNNNDVSRLYEGNWANDETLIMLHDLNRQEGLPKFRTWQALVKAVNALYITLHPDMLRSEARANKRKTMVKLLTDKDCHLLPPSMALNGHMTEIDDLIEAGGDMSTTLVARLNTQGLRFSKLQALREAVSKASVLAVSNCTDTCAMFQDEATWSQLVDTELKLMDDKGRALDDSGRLPPPLNALVPVQAKGVPRHDTVRLLCELVHNKKKFASLPDLAKALSDKYTEADSAAYHYRMVLWQLLTHSKGQLLAVPELLYSDVSAVVQRVGGGAGANAVVGVLNCMARERVYRDVDELVEDMLAMEHAAHADVVNKLKAQLRLLVPTLGIAALAVEEAKESQAAEESKAAAGTDTTENKAVESKNAPEKEADDLVPSLADGGGPVITDRMAMQVMEGSESDVLLLETLRFMCHVQKKTFISIDAVRDELIKTRNACRQGVLHLPFLAHLVMAHPYVGLVANSVHELTQLSGVTLQDVLLSVDYLLDGVSGGSSTYAHQQALPPTRHGSISHPPTDEQKALQAEKKAEEDAAQEHVAAPVHVEVNAAAAAPKEAAPGEKKDAIAEAEAAEGSSEKKGEAAAIAEEEEITPASVKEKEKKSLTVNAPEPEMHLMPLELNVTMPASVKEATEAVKALRAGGVDALLTEVEVWLGGDACALFDSIKGAAPSELAACLFTISRAKNNTLDLLRQLNEENYRPNRILELVATVYLRAVDTERSVIINNATLHPAMQAVVSFLHSDEGVAMVGQVLEGDALSAFLSTIFADQHAYSKVLADLRTFSILKRTFATAQDLRFAIADTHATGLHLRPEDRATAELVLGSRDSKCAAMFTDIDAVWINNPLKGVQVATIIAGSMDQCIAHAEQFIGVSRQFDSLDAYAVALECAILSNFHIPAEIAETIKAALQSFDFGIGVDQEGNNSSFEDDQYLDNVFKQTKSVDATIELMGRFQTMQRKFVSIKEFSAAVEALMDTGSAAKPMERKAIMSVLAEDKDANSGDSQDEHHAKPATFDFPMSSITGVYMDEILRASNCSLGNVLMHISKFKSFHRTFDSVVTLIAALKEAERTQSHVPEALQHFLKDRLSEFESVEHSDVTGRRLDNIIDIIGSVKSMDDLIRHLDFYTAIKRDFISLNDLIEALKKTYETNTHVDDDTATIILATIESDEFRCLNPAGKAKVRDYVDSIVKGAGSDREALSTLQKLMESTHMFEANVEAFVEAIVALHESRMSARDAIQMFIDSPECALLETRDNMIFELEDEDLESLEFACNGITGVLPYLKQLNNNEETFKSFALLVNKVAGLKKSDTLNPVQLQDGGDAAEAKKRRDGLLKYIRICKIFQDSTGNPLFKVVDEDADAMIAACTEVDKATHAITHVKRLEALKIICRSVEDFNGLVKHKANTGTYLTQRQQIKVAAILGGPAFSGVLGDKKVVHVLDDICIAGGGVDSCAMHLQSLLQVQRSRVYRSGIQLKTDLTRAQQENCHVSRAELTKLNAWFKLRESVELFEAKKPVFVTGQQWDKAVILTQSADRCIAVLNNFFYCGRHFKNFDECLTQILESTITDHFLDSDAVSHEEASVREACVALGVEHKLDKKGVSSLLVCCRGFQTFNFIAKCFTARKSQFATREALENIIGEFMATQPYFVKQHGSILTPSLTVLLDSHLMPANDRLVSLMWRVGGFDALQDCVEAVLKTREGKDKAFADFGKVDDAVMEMCASLMSRCDLCTVLLTAHITQEHANELMSYFNSPSCLLFDGSEGVDISIAELEHVMHVVGGIKNVIAHCTKLDEAGRRVSTVFGITEAIVTALRHGSYIEASVRNSLKHYLSGMLPKKVLKHAGVNELDNLIMACRGKERLIQILDIMKTRSMQQYENFQALETQVLAECAKRPAVSDTDRHAIVEFLGHTGLFDNAELNVTGEDLDNLLYEAKGDMNHLFAHIRAFDSVHVKLPSFPALIAATKDAERTHSHVPAAVSEAIVTYLTDKKQCTMLLHKSKKGNQWHLMGQDIDNIVRASHAGVNAELIVERLKLLNDNTVASHRTIDSVSELIDGLATQSSEKNEVKVSNLDRLVVAKFIASSQIFADSAGVEAEAKDLDALIAITKGNVDKLLVQLEKLAQVGRRCSVIDDLKAAVTQGYKSESYIDVSVRNDLRLYLKGELGAQNGLLAQSGDAKTREAVTIMDDELDGIMLTSQSEGVANVKNKIEQYKQLKRSFAGMKEIITAMETTNRTGMFTHENERLSVANFAMQQTSLFAKAGDQSLEVVEADLERLLTVCGGYAATIAKLQTLDVQKESFAHFAELIGATTA